MARVTVEDCVLKVPNRFDLVMIAAQRARAIGAGAALTVDRDNDKNPVIALREIADGTVAIKELEEALIRDQQKHVELEEKEEEERDFVAIQQEMTTELGMAIPAEKFAETLPKEEEEGVDEEAGEEELDEALEQDADLGETEEH